MGMIKDIFLSRILNEKSSKTTVYVMKHSIALLILLFSFLYSIGQEKYSYEFEKLGITDTIYSKEEIASLKIDSDYHYADYFIAERFFKGEIDDTIKCLIKIKKISYIKWFSH